MGNSKTPKKGKGGLLTAVSVGGKHDRAQMERLKRFIRSHAESYLSRPNITSVGIGYKKTAKKRTPVLALQFTVAEKFTPQALAAQGVEEIPNAVEFEGVSLPTDVIQRSFKPSYVKVTQVVKPDRKQRLDPIRPGVSVGSIRCTAGTLGAIVLDAGTGQPVALSNWHVFCGSDGQIGDAVVQPGPYDDNRVSKNKVGQLLRSHLGMAGDCALASIDGRKFDPGILDLGTRVRELGKPELGDLVVKSGRTSGVTYGVVSRIETVSKLDYPGVGSTSIGGFEIEPSPKHVAPNNEISKTGDSGAAWMAAAKRDVMLGLHFGGDADGSDGEVALACYAHSVFEKLEIKPWKGPVSPQAVRRRSLEADESRRLGFDEQFLSFRVPRPRFTAGVASDLVGLKGSDWIDYCHFSVWLSKSRKMPVCVAWNIDGAVKKSLPRKGISFVKDDREGLDAYQFGDELYANNPLDRGHVARRDDLVWGPLPEARQANVDSFFFTNMTPQHEFFNQSKLKGKWGLLENAILDEVALENLRASLLGGPILAKSDPTYRDAQLPREFWKVVCFVDESDSRAKLRAFVLTQADLVKKLKPQTLELTEFQWYQVPVAEVEKRTGIRLAADIKKLDVKTVQSFGASQARLIEDNDFFV